MAITRLAKNPDKLYQIIEYMQYAEEYLHVRYKDAQMLPPLSSVWDHEVFKQPDPRFGGQKLGLLQIELAKELPGSTQATSSGMRSLLISIPS